MAHIKISKANLFHNLDLIKAKVGSKQKIAVVLKDNAYGHGIALIAKLVSEYGVRKAIVRTTQEALLIEPLFEDIVVLSEFSEYVQNEKISYTVNSLDKLATLKDINIELKFDTGMHRNGLSESQIDEALAIIKTNSLNLKGIMTHFRSADELTSEHFWQKKQWQTIKERFKKFDIRVHSQNSSSTFRDNFHEDFVRLGIALYGYLYLPYGVEFPVLEPVMSLWGERIASRALRSGSRIGYGGDTTVWHDTVVSTYDVGYGDGFLRLSSEKSYTLPNGSKLIGRVSMDSISVESSEEQICIFDDANVLAELNDTNTYDILVKLSPLITRAII